MPESGPIGPGQQPLKRMWSSRLAAPLAALLGVYPTVARSLHEGIRYVAGFLLGAALAIPAGVVLGPGIAGIAIVVIGGVLVSGWQRLGNQGPQVTFTALSRSCWAAISRLPISLPRLGPS
jgi:hypothetical protein